MCSAAVSNVVLLHAYGSGCGSNPTYAWQPTWIQLAYTLSPTSTIRVGEGMLPHARMCDVGDRTVGDQAYREINPTVRYG